MEYLYPYCDIGFVSYALADLMMVLSWICFAVDPARNEIQPGVESPARSLGRGALSI